MVVFIKKKRRRELCLEEGHRWFDIRRWQVPIHHRYIDVLDQVYEVDLAPGSLLYALPIPHIRLWKIMPTCNKIHVKSTVKNQMKQLLVYISLVSMLTACYKKEDAITPTTEDHGYKVPQVLNAYDDYIVNFYKNMESTCCMNLPIRMCTGALLHGR